MNRRNFLVNGGVTVTGLALPGWANAIGVSSTEFPVAILRPSAIPSAVNIASALADTLLEVRQASCQLDIDGGNAQSITRALTTPACTRWLAVLDPAGAVIVGELARSFGLGLRWSSRHAIGNESARHHGAVAGLDASLAWQTDSESWRSSSLDSTPAF